MNIGAPNSIARYCSNYNWGDNEWAVFRYNQGMPFCVASGPTKEEVQIHTRADYIMVELSHYKRLQDESCCTADC